MARSGRFERPTLCFGGTRSIQLSYERAEEQLSYCNAKRAGSRERTRESESALRSLLNLASEFFDLFGLLNQSEGERGGRVSLFDLRF